MAMDIMIPVLAILWLAIAWLWVKLGDKSKKGLTYLSVGAMWLVFYSAFNVLGYVLMEGYASMAGMVDKIGLYIGGGLAWVFAFIAAITIVMEMLK